ncbi:MAG TPA: dockerin type I repeat-containing protein [Tepidisphaeraceae bacterium]|jgi:autotransporter-associated beta strand protein
MKRSLICSAAALAALALAATRASAQLIYSFETLYDATDTINPAGTRPDDFHTNGGGITVTQSTIGVTDGSNSMEFTQVGGATFSGAQTEVVPDIINDPSTVALSFDITIPATGNFTGTFARIGVSEFGNNSSQNINGAQVQTTGSSECNIDLLPGTYQLTVPLIALANQVNFNTDVPFSTCFGSDPSSELVVSSFEFYFSKSADMPLNVYLDNVHAIQTASVSTWSNATGGSWSTIGDWSPTIPQFALDTADLEGAIAGNSTIDLDGSRSVATLNFNSAHQYTIAAGSGGTLSLDAGGSSGIAAINDLGGTHNIAVPVNLSTSTTITVTNAADTLNISGPISGGGGLTVQGGGTVDISGSNTYQGGTTVSSGVLVLGSSTAVPASNSVISIASGAKVQLAMGIGSVTSQIPTIAAGGSLDLTNNHMFINYAAGAQAATDLAVRNYLISGYAGGAWNGTGGINSSLAAATPGFAVGYADGADGVVVGLTSGQVELKYTRYGDANLDGVVSGVDFTILVGNLGKSVSAWDKGDFNYDGVVSGVDFTLLVGNLGKAANGADITLPAADLAAIDAFAAANGLMTSVPEPTSIGLAIVVGMSALSMRRRHAATFDRA